jgi:hypothetical protein
VGDNGYLDRQKLGSFEKVALKAGAERGGRVIRGSVVTTLLWGPYLCLGIVLLL